MSRPVTFSPKVFLPLTNLCRNRCDYCSFRRSPGEPGEWTMAPDEVRATLAQGRALGCTEALFCLGDTPPGSFPAYHALLRSWGHGSTVDYLVWAGREALAAGLLPHTNAGLLSKAEMARLAEVNVSLGLMLESTSERLCGPGGPHAQAPDKAPARRVQMIREAGELGIPFTSGLLVGIGETAAEREDTLRVLADLHAAYGHLQEVIVQPYRTGPRSRREGEVEDPELLDTIRLARARLPPEVAVQAPPNLAPGAIPALLDAGLDDLGGISPVTPDYINPVHPWPMLDALREACASVGRVLAPRLPVYPRWYDAVAPGLQASLAAAPAAWARLPLGREAA